MRVLITSVARDQEGGITELHLEGDIDIAVLPELHDALEAATRLRPRRVVLDLSRSRYTEAQAILVLVEAARQLARHEGSLVLRGCSEETVRLFDLADVFEEFIVEDSSEAVVA